MPTKRQVRGQGLIMVVDHTQNANRASRAAKPLLLAAALLAGPLGAQGNSWAEIVPTNGVPAASVSSIGKLAHFVEGTTLHVWSAFTRRWHQLGISSNASIRQTNDWLVVQEGNVWTAFAAAGGRFAPLQTGSGAIVLNPASQNNDSVLIIRDGTQVHAFSGFLGRWVSRNTSASATCVVRRHTAMLSTALPTGAGSIVSGFSAFTGFWHDQALAQPALSLSADGTAGVVETATDVFGFSARRGTWATTPRLINTTRFRDDDWASWYDGVHVLAFSGLRGDFALQAIGPGSVQHLEELYVLYNTPNTTYGYSAITGNWSSTSSTANTTTRGADAVALLEGTNVLTAYSATLDVFVSTSTGSSASALSGSVIAVTEQATGAPLLFSGLTGTWQPAPGDSLAALPQLATVSALLVRNGGFYAFSARTGSFIPVDSPGGNGVTTPQTAPTVVWDASALHFFDARRDLWISEARSSAAPPTIHLWRTTGMVFDGNDVVGFGTQNGRVERVTLTEPTLAFRANSESLTVTTANRVQCFSALGQPNTLAQFPDFRRVVCLGSVINIQVPLEQGEFAFLAGGFLDSQPTVVPGVGQLLIEPQGMATALVLPRNDADRGEFLLDVPDLPALRGTRVWFQTLTVPLGAIPYLGQGCVVWIG